jgi:hypothetical protein
VATPLATKPGNGGNLPSFADLLKRYLFARKLRTVDDLGGGSTAGDLHILDPGMLERT